MARLPEPGGDDGTWGGILNDYLSQSLASDGKLKTDSVTAAQLAPGSVQGATIANSAITTIKIIDGAVTESKLDPTFAATLVPPVTSVNTKIGAVVLDKTDIGLTNVDNTSDANKPISSATQTALDDKAAAVHAHTAANISDSTAVGRSVMTAADAATARTAIGAGTGSVTSVNTKTGVVTLDKTDIGLTNVDNTSDTNKPVSSATQTALDSKAATVHAHTAANISDSTAVGRSLITTVDAATARTAIGAGTSSLVIGTTAGTAKEGDYQPAAANISDSTAVGRSLVTAADAAAARTAIGAGTGGVTSVNTKTGVVVLDKTDIGLTNIDNTSDANKPISSATQTALDGKAVTVHTHTAANISDSTAIGQSLMTAVDVAAAKTAISLINVDNTRDANKPISSATQAALNGKEDSSNKSTDIITDAASDTKYPSVKSVKDYVDPQISQKQTVITASGILKGSGAGSISAASHGHSGDILIPTDVQDNVTGTATDLPLSQNQGNLLNTSISQLANGTGIALSLQGEYFIGTTDDPQTIIDAAPAGSKITFCGGVHTHGVNVTTKAMVYINKSLHIHIPKTATLKVADGSATVNKNAELITNFHASNPITGLLIDSTGYNLGEVVRTYEIKIDGTGIPNTFKYQIRDFANAVVTDWSTGHAITGSYQALADGITVKFPQTTGYTLNAGCIVAVGTAGYYVVRVGIGTQADYIDGVTITGEGLIDQNQTNNAYSNLYSLNLNCGLLINGRVKNVEIIDKIRFNNCNRTIILLGENVGGTFNLDGTVTGGTSYDIDTVTIKNTIADGTGNISGALFGHPEHRGLIKNLIFDNNRLSTQLVAIEPNNLLQDYTIRRNDIILLTSTAYAVSCWRNSTRGLICDNTARGSIYPFISIDAPSGWVFPTNIRNYDNYVIPSITANLYQNQEFTQGSFALVGDAKLITGTQLVATSDATATVLSANGSTTYTATNLLVMPINTTWAYKIVVVGRSSTGAKYGMWEASGIITKETGTCTLAGNTVTKIYANDAGWNCEVLASGSFYTLVIRVTGTAATVVRWVAKIDITQVRYG